MNASLEVVVEFLAVEIACPPVPILPRGGICQPFCVYFLPVHGLCHASTERALHILGLIWDVVYIIRLAVMPPVGVSLSARMELALTRELCICTFSDQGHASYRLGQGDTRHNGVLVLLSSSLGLLELTFWSNCVFGTCRRNANMIELMNNLRPNNKYVTTFE